MPKLIILKLGGSVITNKKGFKDVKINVLEKVSAELAEAMKIYNFKLIIIHGGGSFGHPLAYKFKITEGFKYENSILGFSETIDSMRELSLHVTHVLRKFDIPAMPIQTSAIALTKKDKISEFFSDSINIALENGLVPVLWGDAVLDLEKGCTILSGDEIIYHLSKQLRPYKVIFGTDVDGVFLDFPTNLKLVHKINSDNLNEVLKAIRPVEYTDVTGGFYRKMKVIVDIAKMGIKVQIINLLKEENLLKSISEKEIVGTVIEL